MLGDQRDRSDPSTADETTRFMRDTGRIEAFSDGVFAIAITLLVLEIRVPDLEGVTSSAALWRALADLWPSYLSFVVSFIVIGIIWVNHHNMFKYIRRSNHSLLLLNVVLLLCISFIPFPTALLAEYITVPGQDNVAAIVYSGTMLMMGISFYGVWSYAAHRPALWNNAIDPRMRQRMKRRNQLGTPLYLLAFGLAFWSVAASMVVVVLAALWYALPGPEERGRSIGSIHAPSTSVPPQQ